MPRLVRSRSECGVYWGFFVFVVGAVALGFALAAWVRAPADPMMVEWSEEQSRKRDVECAYGSLMFRQCEDHNRNGACEASEMVSERRICTPGQALVEAIHEIEVHQQNNPVDEVQNTHIGRLDARDVEAWHNVTQLQYDLGVVSNSLSVETALRAAQYDEAHDERHAQHVRIAHLETSYALLTGNLSEPWNATLEAGALRVDVDDALNQTTVLLDKWRVLDSYYWALRNNNTLFDARLLYLEDAAELNMQHVINTTVSLYALNVNQTDMMAQLELLRVANQTHWAVTLMNMARLNLLQSQLNGQSDPSVTTSALATQLALIQNNTQIMLTVLTQRVSALESAETTLATETLELRETSNLLNMHVGLLETQGAQHDARISYMESVQSAHDLRLAYMENNATRVLRFNQTLQETQNSVGMLNATLVSYLGQLTQTSASASNLSSTASAHAMALASIQSNMQNISQIMLEKTQLMETLDTRTSGLESDMTTLQASLDALYNLSSSVDENLNSTVLEALGQALVVAQQLDALSNYTHTTLTAVQNDMEADVIALNVSITQAIGEQQSHHAAIVTYAAQISALDADLQSARAQGDASAAQLGLHGAQLNALSARVGALEEAHEMAQDGLVKTYETLGVVCASGMSDPQGTNLWSYGGSVTRTASGRYTITFDTPFTHANYPIFLNLCGDAEWTDHIQVDSKNTLGFSVLLRRGNGENSFVDRHFSWGATCQKRILVDVSLVS